jgi:hypothetical protein
MTVFILMTLEMSAKSPEAEGKLGGNRLRAFFPELLLNTIYFPLANIALELIISGSAYYLREPDPYIIIVACLVQATLLSTWKAQGKNRRLLGNLVGPAIYTLGELFVEGMLFFSSPHHLLYWIVSLLMGLTQQFNHQESGKIADVLIVIEHLLRTSIVLFMYAIFESTVDNKPIVAFFAHDSHIFVTVVVLLLGLVLGITNVMSNHYLQLLKKTTANLHIYSNRFLGNTLLSQALDDSDALSPRRRERTVLFADIREFTRWSETRSPEEVAKMLNRYFQNAEHVLSGLDSSMKCNFE